ncbi:unnamed protein product [Tetraodon nigroviridis]|uniref:(spotted green pufferfish) hypothetical protein n=1 Tax=Tetraodon nigroviridis TaxID=99883 RepID=Q4SAW3_TETNG|nr:unnamed protein product [Tetraodon nigroviridis]
MGSAREKLQTILCRYAKDTLSYINRVKSFCDGSSNWILQRKTEVESMMDIKDRAEKINLSFSHVSQSENKGRALWEYLRSATTLQVNVDKKFAALEEELAEVLKSTDRGLQELDEFLYAVEKLAFTSLHVFKEKNNMLRLPAGISLDLVQALIGAAQHGCSLRVLLILDSEEFFVPRLQNVDVLLTQLNKYVGITQLMCDQMEKSNWCPRPTKDTSVELDVDLSEEDIQNMLTHIKQLHSIRLDQTFRTASLFQGEDSSTFIKEFDGRRDRMLKFLDAVEESADQLDRMHLGARISSIASSSVGATGGVLTIVGLALSPVTAGLSLGLTIAGIGMGVTSGVNSIVTTATEAGVNSTQKNKANEALENFMEDIKVLRVCLKKIAMEKTTEEELSAAIGKVVLKLCGVARAIDGLVDAVSAFRMFKTGELLEGAANVAQQAGRGAGRVAQELPDMGQAAARGPLVMAKAARAGLIVVNALFVTLDVFFIVKDGMSLAKGSKNELAKFLRARAALWRSQMKAWEKIYKNQKEGEKRVEKNQAVLKTPFYPSSPEEEEEKVEE